MAKLESLPSLQFLSLLLLCCVSPSSFQRIDDLVDGFVACHPRQLQALTQFKNEFDSHGCNHSDDSMNGVWCDNSTGVVTKLRLTSCLSGTLKSNSSLFGLHQLRYLDLSNNNFNSSSLPYELGNLSKLEVLSLSSSGFFGQVPSSFSNLTMLSYLGLSQNELTGSFPLLRNLNKLSFLQLSNNHFSGTLNFLFELHHLRVLSLSFNNFRSSLPSEIGNLHKLEVLSLSSNSFFGQVPSTISNLTLLARLLLSDNDFTGSLPLVQNLTNLYDLVLSSNHFTGTIPSSLLTMPSLEYLDLRENNLAGYIEIPNSSTSSNLKFLYLSNNHFDGKILEPISKLITLTHLHLSFLNITHPVDLNMFSSLKSLVYIDLSGNSILPTSLSSDSRIPLSMEFLVLSSCNITEFPRILKTLENLQHLDISNNGIKGKIPEWFWSLPKLNSVDLSNNSFNGFEGSSKVLVNSSVKILVLASNSFEGAFPELPLSIISFSAWNNSFKGNIPLSLCNRNSLMVLDLSENRFTGSIPRCLSNLTFLVIRKNNLEGSLPDVFHDGASLRTLDVGYNQLTGELPRSLLNCSSLKFLNVEHNNIKDTFPFWLKALLNLQVLILRSNKFHGPISPPDNGPLGFPELSIFEISDNKFNGSLSSSYFVNWKAPSLQMNEDGSIYMGYRRENSFSITGYYIYQDAIDLKYKGLVMEQAKVLTSYSAIDFSGNRLEGQIPESIGLLKALIALNLSNNVFSGHIPLSLANLTSLQSLDLSRNQLSGEIPKELGSLSFLAYINMSHNQLTGEIPQGTQFSGQAESSFEGNVGLCGLPLQGSCFAEPRQQPKEEEDEEEEEEVLNWKGVVIGYGPGVLFGLVLAQVIASYKPKWFGKIVGSDKRKKVNSNPVSLFMALDSEWDSLQSNNKKNVEESDM